MILTKGAAMLELSDDLLWSDETQWSAVAASDTRAISGGVIRQVSVKTAGRPITLRSDPDMGLIRRADVSTLRAWSDDPAAAMTLAFAAGDSYTVRFRYDDGSPVEAEPALGFTRRHPDEWWRLTLKLITV